jgi:hypothetical protein
MSQPGTSSSVRASVVLTMSPENTQTTEWSLKLIGIVVSMICSATLMIIGYNIQGQIYNYNHGVM